jgi:prepilin-type N-terminal cleavage/methylation domain-containing protein
MALSRSRYTNSGFTLAELLVSTMLLSIVMTSVYMLFYTVLGSWKAVETRFETYRETRNAMTVMEHDIENYLYAASHLFEGEDDELILFVITEAMDLDEEEGAHLMRVRYYHNRSGKELIREEAVVTAALPARPAPGEDLDRERIRLSRKKKYVVAENVRRFDIQYVWAVRPQYMNQPPDPTEFMYRDQHRERWGLPQALRVQMQVQDPENRDKNFTIDHGIIIRAPNHPRQRDALEKLFESAEDGA